MSRIIALTAGFLTVTLVLLGVSADAQQPSTPAPADQAPAAQQRPPFRPRPTNLQVLPKDIAPEALLATMRGFTQALDVRCLFCHVGEEGQPFDTFDFASDEKDHKRMARAMLRMVGDINDSPHLKEVASIGGDGDVARVTCYTCHRGAQTPRTVPPRTPPGAPPAPAAQPAPAPTPPPAGEAPQPHPHAKR